MLAGTKWGANSKILQQVYTGAVRPVMEYGSSAWATSAKRNSNRLTKLQNTGMCLITGGMKTTLISALEQTTTPKEREPLIDVEDWTSSSKDITIVEDVPGITRKGEQSDAILKSLTLEMLQDKYNTSQWTHVYTDGSAEEAIKNAGSGVHIRFPDGPLDHTQQENKLQSRKKSPSSSHQNHQFGESTSITCCVLDRLQISHSEHLNFFLVIAVQQGLADLSLYMQVVVQWVPTHCGIAGNEYADKLTKAGNTMEQPNHTISLRETKTIIKRKFRFTNTRTKDPIHHLERYQETTMFRLRTGHCHLGAHMYRLKLADTDECPCQTGPQSPEHILQFCPL
ncbi:uncharacterized protein LOC121369872 [Gigantopelta aegis]|uniref:uncharacterized protein LOC121369872 n=1 Tax=Gigantopelta aegis TaxID=1735272 RepID=UPI001B8886CB|nr:uncharacterized protein LOC121369872 [Gigantopelta aegis]